MWLKMSVKKEIEDTMDKQSDQKYSDTESFHDSDFTDKKDHERNIKLPNVEIVDIFK